MSFFKAATLVLLCSCISGSASDSITDTSTISIPGSPISVPNTVLSQTFPVDLSDAISKLNSLGTPSFTITENRVLGDISFASHLSIDLERAGGSSLLLSDLDIHSSSMVNDIPVLVSGNDLLSYLSSGPCLLRFSITGSPPNQDTKLTHQLVLSANESINKSL